MMFLLLKSAIVLSILLGFYKLFLQKESFFSINRAYLIIGLVLTFTLPFVVLPELVSHQGIVDKVISKTKSNPNKKTVITEDSELTAVVHDNETKQSTEVTTASKASYSMGVSYWMRVLYFFGVGILSLNFLTQLFGLLLKISKSRNRLKDDGCVILNQTDETEPSSFFNYVFVNPSKYDSDTYGQIIEHEKVHVRQYHSLDLILSELAIILLWFNPLVWYYRKEVEKNIEYQTDAMLLTSKKVLSEEYQMNLLRIASRRKSNTLVSNYNQSLIKKRIIMMNKQKSNNKSYWKYAFLAPTLFVTLLVLNQPLVINAQENDIENFQQEQGDGVFYEDEYDNGHSEDLTPFLRAAANGNEETVKMLIDEGADVNEFLHGEGTALYLALQHSHHHVAKLLLDEGADPNLGSKSDGYPIMVAISEGDFDLVKLLIEKGADVNRKYRGDGSALIHACKYGHFSIVELLVASGAKIDMPVRGDGNPLIMAAKAGHSKIVEYLVQKGANVNYEVPGDEVPLMNASEQGHIEIVKYLIAKGADVNKKCVEQVNGKTRIRTALKMAKKQGHDEIVSFLKQKGATE